MPHHYQPIVASLLSIWILAPFAAGKDLNVNGFFPPAAQAGESVDIQARGEPTDWPVAAWIDRPGIELIAKEEKGQFTIRVAADAEPGMYWIRLTHRGAASQLLPFIVGQVPAVLEAEPNDRTTESQVVALPIGISGRLQKAGDVDGFRFTAEKGDQWQARLQAHRVFGSPMDGVIQLCTSEGLVLAQNDDAVGLDPHLSFIIPEDGDYIARVVAFPAVPNSTIGFAGGERFVYRLVMTVGPFVDLAMVPRTGPTIDNGDDPVGPSLQCSRNSYRQSATAFVPGAAGYCELPDDVVGRVAMVHQSEEDEIPVVPLPGEAWGVIADGEQRDRYRVVLTNGDKIRINAHSRQWGFELDSVVRMLKPDGTVLGENDDGGPDRDAKLDFQATEDGEFIIEVADITRRGGRRAFYHLSVDRVVPTFRLNMASDRIALSAGQPAAIEVAVQRLDGFDKPIKISCLDLPPGVTCAEVISDPKDASKDKVTLSLTSEEDIAGQPIRVIGVPDGQAVREPTEARFQLSDGHTRHSAVWLYSQ